MDIPLVWCILGAILLVISSIIIYANLPIKWHLGVDIPSTDFMAQAKLVLIRDEARIDMEEKVEAEKLLDGKPTIVVVVRRPGCPLCRQHAIYMTNIMPEVEAAGIQMFAVVHEPLGVNSFKKKFKGNVFFDDERRFYGEKQRWLPHWLGFLRIMTFIRLLPAMWQVGGDLKGEGRLLGGVYLIANGKCAWSHLETAWGDVPDEDEVRKVIADYGYHRLNI